MEYGKNNPAYRELEKQQNSKFYEDEINYTEKCEFANLMKQLSGKDIEAIVALLE